MNRCTMCRVPKPFLFKEDKHNKWFCSVECLDEYDEGEE